MYSGASLLRTLYMNKPLLYSSCFCRLIILISFNFWSVVRERERERERVNKARPDQLLFSWSFWKAINIYCSSLFATQHSSHRLRHWEMQYLSCWLNCCSVSKAWRDKSVTLICSWSCKINRSVSVNILQCVVTFATAIIIILIIKILKKKDKRWKHTLLSALNKDVLYKHFCKYS